MFPNYKTYVKIPLMNSKTNIWYISTGNRIAIFRNYFTGIANTDGRKYVRIFNSFLNGHRRCVEEYGDFLKEII